MFPIRDDAPRFTFPFINYFLIMLNTGVFLFDSVLDNRSHIAFVYQFAFVPAHVNQWLAGTLPAGVALLPVFTSMFLHANFLHLLLNMWALAIFGDNVEDRLGHLRYLIFYLLCGFGAELAHYVFNYWSDVPSLGASGAIAGVMGAYFILFPTARVTTWPLVFFKLPAWLVLGYWFVLQFLSGAASVMTFSHDTTGGVAVWAHVGGFITGLLLIRLMPARSHYQSLEGY